MTAVKTTPGYREECQPNGDAAQHLGGQLEPTVEKDERDAERQEQLRAHRVERHVDRVREGRPEESAGDEEYEHAGNAREVGDQLADEPGPEHDRDRQDHVLDGHAPDSALVPRTRQLSRLQCVRP